VLTDFHGRLEDGLKTVKRGMPTRPTGPYMGQRAGRKTTGAAQPGPEYILINAGEARDISYAYGSVNRMNEAYPRLILFDFDGTIADSMSELIDIYNNVLAPTWHSRPVHEGDRERLRLEKPARLMRMFRISPVKLPLMVLQARRELASRMSSVRPQPGVVEALRTLAARGCRMGVLTSNSAANVKDFVERNGLQDVFDFIRSGRQLFGKASLLHKLLREQGVRPVEAVYVGDEDRDIEAAHAAGMTAVGVAWGFAGKVAMEAARPDILLNDPSELPNVLQP